MKIIKQTLFFFIGVTLLYSPLVYSAVTMSCPTMINCKVSDGRVINCNSLPSQWTIERSVLNTQLQGNYILNFTSAITLPDHQVECSYDDTDTGILREINISIGSFDLKADYEPSQAWQKASNEYYKAYCFTSNADSKIPKNPERCLFLPLTKN